MCTIERERVGGGLKISSMSSSTSCCVCLNPAINYYSVPCFTRMTRLLVATNIFLFLQMLVGL